MTIPESGSRRKEGRLEVNLPALLLSYRSRREVRIWDLSSNGAMVAGDDLPAKGDEVVLSRGAIEIVATVMWVIDSNCGLSFHRHVEPRSLIKAVP